MQSATYANAQRFNLRCDTFYRVLMVYLLYSLYTQRGVSVLVINDDAVSLLLSGE